MLVLSNYEYNMRTSDIVVAAITSNLEEKEYAVIVKKGDLVEGKLKVDSIIRAH